MINWKIIFFILYISIGCAQKIDLNTAEFTELESVNLSSAQINDIIDYRNRISYISNIYDLLNVNSISIQDIHKIRQNISLLPPKNSTFENDFKKASYKMGRWISNEGSTEGLSEIWLDKFFEPDNINNMSYDDLMALPNLSPIDVTAVLKQKQRGYINGNFELKNSPGISYWGYKNLIDFVRFKDKSNHEKGFHIRFNSLFRTLPITSNPDDEGTIQAFKNTSLPEQFHKISITSDMNLKGGLSYNKYMGQPDSIFTFKGFLQLESLSLGLLKLEKLILGNFTSSFGQGIIFETNDNFSPRRTGFGFSKRAEGIHGDLTRSSQYVMQGIATQISVNKFRGTLFSSMHPRDAVINADSSFTSLIVMQPRLPFGVNGKYNINTNGDTVSTNIYSSIVNSVMELTWGGNLRFSPIIGTNIGFSFFESLYDREHIPQIINSITGGNDDTGPGFNLDDYDNYSGDAFYLQYITNSSDSEIAAMDSSIADSPLWDQAQSFFRVRGFDFSTVLSNIAIQGEYGEILKDDNIFSFGRSPSALVLSIFAQFDNLNLITLYRNYDLKYDNPYQRSFSNYQRYKTSIFEDDYWLTDPIFSYLYSANPQPQAEEGFFISSRYQFHRSMVGYLNWDTWNRKADNSKYYRTVATIDWRPAFNCRIKLRQKWQARGSFDIQHPSPFYSRETRVTARLRMSKYNQFEILYTNGYTTFSPRPRLTDNALGGNMLVGNIGSPDESIGLSIFHNATQNFSFKTGIIYINGFLWYFEDTDFRVFNSENGSIHSWASVDLKPTSLFRIMFKVSYSAESLSTQIVDGQTKSGSWITNPTTSHEEFDYRIQISYAL